MCNYSDFVQRMIAYRERFNLTQQDMSDLFGVHQSNYGRYETGDRIVSHKSLQNFCANGGDLFVLLTGMDRVEGPINQYLACCKTTDGSRKLTSFLVWCVEFGWWMEHRQQDKVVLPLKKTLRLLELKPKMSSLWEGIRKVENLTQVQMADALGMETKRYRRIEKNGKVADVEVYCTLFERFKYSPLMFFDIERYFVDELNYCWSLLAPNVTVFLEKMIRETIVRIEEAESLGTNAR